MRTKSIFFASLFLLSCTINKSAEVKIVINKSIVQVGETITARLYVDHNDSINPAYHIITNQDTARIPVDSDDNDCGVFNAAATKPGKIEYRGFVEFTDNNNIERKSNFIIRYSVKH